MSNTKKIKAGLVLQEPSEFVGQAGTIFYNPDTGSMYLSDGVTPGGISLGQGGGGGGFSGNYNDLTNKPNLQAYANTTYVDNKATWGNITGKPSFATVATTGNYNDLTNKPTIPSITGLATETFVNNALASKIDSTSLALVATSGNYNDLEYLPTISTAGRTGNYEDLNNKPSIPSVVGLATENYVTSQGYITSSALSTTLNDYATKTYVGSQNFITTTNLLAYDYVSNSSLNSRHYITLGDIPTIPTDIANLTDNTDLLLNKANVLHLSNTTASTTSSNGALITDGGLGVAGNINANGIKHIFNGNIHMTGVDSHTLYVGSYAETSDLVAPTLVMHNEYGTYIQAVIINGSPNGSSDWVAYGDQGNDSSGWADMGFTSHNFNDINYSITGPGDGYFFVKGQVGFDGQGGNLVIATDGVGTHNDIVFGMGGFYSDNVFAVMSNSTKTFTVNGNIAVTGSLVSTGASPAPTLDGFNIVNSVGANLGHVGNVKIGGGSSGQILMTDGAGNLSWSSPLGGGGTNTGDIGFEGTWIRNTNGGAIYISPQDGNTWLYLPSDTDAGNQASELVNFDANGIVNIRANSHTWQYSHDGMLTFPNGAKIGSGDSGKFATDNQATTSLDLRDSNGAGFYTNGDGYTLRSNSSENWIFGTSGTLTVPGHIHAQEGNDLNVRVYNPLGGGVGINFINNDVDTGSKTTQVNIGAANIQLTTDFSGAENTWNFDNAGVLHLPVNGDIVDSNGVTVLGGSGGNPFNQSLNSSDTPSFSGITINGNVDYSSGVIQRSGGYVTCNPNMDTVVYTGTANFQTLKLLFNIEGVEDGQSDTDTQSCEMIVAKSIRNNTVSGSAYGLVYTSANPLVTLSTRWNSSINRVEIICRPTSTMNSVSVLSTCTEIFSATLY